MKRLILAAALAIMLLPGQARACMISDALETLIHDALPRPLPRGTIIANVTFESTSEAQLHGGGIRATVRRMIQGDFRGRTLIVRQRIISSCDDPFGNGRSGLIVSVPIGMENGMLVVAPILVSRLHRRRLPDGFQLPDAVPGAIPLQQ
jgi:hypothetical protein